MKNNLTTVHHLVPKSIGGSNELANIRRINDSFHRAFHRVFENRSPVWQIAMLMDLNSPCLSMQYCVRVNELLKDCQDPDFVYKKWVLVPREEFISKKNG